MVNAKNVSDKGNPMTKRKEQKQSKVVLDKILIGGKFGKLLVKSLAPKELWIRNESYFICDCDCGKSGLVINGCRIKNGSTQSCGCLKLERQLLAKTTHGHTSSKASSGRRHRSPTYRTWETMKRRCLSPVSANYHLYGGRGITVCPEWIESFDAFLRDMGEQPSPSHSLDRINGDLGYSKDNCRWATWVQQGRNRANNRKLTLNGITRCVSEWCEITGLAHTTIHSRLVRGWSEEEALTVKPLTSPTQYKNRGRNDSQPR